MHVVHTLQICTWLFFTYIRLSHVFLSTNTKDFPFFLSLFSLLHTCHTNISPLSTYILLTPISVSYKSNSSLVFLSNIHIFSHGYTQTQMHSLMGFHRYVYLLILVQFSSVQFSHSVVSDSLRPHGLQHARPPCPSPTPGAYSNSCPLSQ